MDQLKDQEPEKLNRLTGIFKKISNRLSELFRPEEVEVTFRKEGNTVRYTYTIVEHKRVA